MSFGFGLIRFEGFTLIGHKFIYHFRNIVREHKVCNSPQKDVSLSGQSDNRILHISIL